MKIDKVAILVKKASLEFDKISNPLFLSHNLTAAQYKILKYLYMHQDETVKMVDLEKCYSLTHPTAIGLLDALEEKGMLEDTVIVISGDHYPYGLEVSEMEELYGGELDTAFEMYRSTLIIWNSGMEPVEVEKYCCSLDIMPTLCNLFALPYDSRLVMGTDILSDSAPLIVFNDRSFITEFGRYSARRDTFIPNEGVAPPDGYAAMILKRVNDKFSYSAKVLENDYYRRVFGE